MQQGFIAELRNEYNQRNQDKITLSIRLSVKEDVILQELANALDTTRQEIISKLIEKHIVKEWENEQEKDKQFDETQDNSTHVKFYLLNTNSANDVADHDFMIKNQVAAAFEDGYKEKIKRIKQGDYVFLYASRHGIVAYGQASGILEKTHHYGIENKTFFQKLEHFTDMTTKPITAKQVKAILGYSFPFAQTLSQMVDGDKLLEYIEKNQS